MQESFNNYYHYIATLLLPIPPSPRQLHKTETFLDFKQNGFYTGNWTLIKLLEGLKAWALG